MAHFVNPFTDIGFKIIFGQPASKELLITLLNELLAGEHHIEDLTFIDKEDNSDNVNDRGIIFDLYCLTSSGEYIIVEMTGGTAISWTVRCITCAVPSAG